MIRFNDSTAIREISRAAGVPFISNYHQCIARFAKDGALCGGVFFTDYNVGSIQIHVAGFRKFWLDRALLWLVFDYAFNKLKVKKIIATIRETNISSIDFCVHIGFSIEARISDVFADSGMVILGCYRAEARRWLEMRPPRFTLDSKPEGADFDGEREPAA